MRKTIKKRIASTAASCALIGAIGLSGVMAYQSDAEKAINTFTIGDVKIELLEPNYPGNSEPTVANLIPNQTIAKDPKVLNAGVNDAVIFMTLDSPLEYVTLVDNAGEPVDKYQLTRSVTTDDGSGPVTTSTTSLYPQAKVQEIFWFKDKDDEPKVYANNFDSNWTPLSAKEMYVVIDRHGNEQIVAMSNNSFSAASQGDVNYDLDDTTKARPMVLSQFGIDLATSRGITQEDIDFNQITVRQQALQAIYASLPEDSRLVRRYVFAYNTDTQGSTQNDDDAVRASAKLGDAVSEHETTNLFDKIQLKSFVESEIKRTAQDIVIRAYAIQAEEILEASIDLTDAFTERNLNHIYDIFVNQNIAKDGGNNYKVINLRDADSVDNTNEGEYTRRQNGSYDDPVVPHTNRWGSGLDVGGEYNNMEFATGHTHNWVLSESDEGTCTTEGHELYTCTDCTQTKVVLTGITVPHQYQLKGMVGATCTAPKMEIYECSVCGHEDRRPVGNTLAHMWVEVETVAPTETEEGYTVYKCSMCNETKHDNFVPATGP